MIYYVSLYNDIWNVFESCSVLGKEMGFVCGENLKYVYVRGSSLEEALELGKNFIENHKVNQ